MNSSPAANERRNRMTDLSVDVYTSPMRELSTGGQFSPTTSTLITGPSEAVLVDAQYMESDVAEIARRIEASGRTLTTIYITHAHADHYFGLGWLLDRFPRARAVALPSVAAEIETGNEAARAQWRDWFGGEALDNTVVPEPLDGDVITVDGQPLRAVAVGQADIPNNTVLYAPSIGAVIAGDVIYNGINPFLAASGPAEWPQWIASVDKVAALNPRIVVAGHKRPELPDDDLTATIDATRDYIRHFIQELDDSKDSRELVTRMQRRFPDHGNPSALILSAVVAFRRNRPATA
jgi:glyoxylase-like metal-dependent hydrolase (beta-lactamase superfamily II)